MEMEQMEQMPEPATIAEALERAKKDLSEFGTAIKKSPALVSSGEMLNVVLPVLAQNGIGVVSSELDFDDTDVDSADERYTLTIALHCVEFVHVATGGVHADVYFGRSFKGRRAAHVNALENAVRSTVLN